MFTDVLLTVLSGVLSACDLALPYLVLSDGDVILYQAQLVQVGEEPPGVDILQAISHVQIIQGGQEHLPKNQSNERVECTTNNRH